MPIARREMLLQARSPAMFRGRIITGIVMIVGGLAFAIAYARAGVGASVFLGVMTYIMSLMCMFTGAQVTADAIARERREGTLGLLILTGLSTWQITLGKLLANILGTMMRVFLIFPLLSMLMILGGVMPLQVVGIVLALCNTLFVTSCIGLYQSTVSLDHKRAAGRATFVVMFLWWGLPMLAQINNRLAGPSWLSSILLLCSLNSSLIPNFAAIGIPVAAASGLHVVCTHLLGWMFLLVATWRVRHRWQDIPKRKGYSWKEMWSRWSLGSEEIRRKLRARLVDRNPFLWLACRDRLRPAGIWLVTGLMIAIGVWVYFESGWQIGPAFGFCVALTLVHRFMAVSFGAAQLMQDQEQGTLEMLLSTPLSPREVLRGQFLAAYRQMRWPVVAVLATHVVVWLLFENAGMPRARIAVAISAASYLFDFYTAIWLSMWGAIISRDSKKASGAALARLMGLPFFVSAITTITVGLLNAFFNAGIEPSPVVIATGLATLVIGNNIYWLQRAHRELPILLRTYAFRRYEQEEDLGFFGRTGRALGRAFQAGQSSSIRSVST